MSLCVCVYSTGIHSCWLNSLVHMAAESVMVECTQGILDTPPSCHCEHCRQLSWNVPILLWHHIGQNLQWILIRYCFWNGGVVVVLVLHELMHYSQRYAPKQFWHFCPSVLYLPATQLLYNGWSCVYAVIVHNTIRYDSGYLTCSKKLTGSQLSLPHGINRKLKCETKNKMMSVISPVRSRYREAVQ